MVNRKCKRRTTPVRSSKVRSNVNDAQMARLMPPLSSIKRLTANSGYSQLLRTLDATQVGSADPLSGDLRPQSGAKLREARYS
jgi:hypothetical protein